MRAPDELDAYIAQERLKPFAWGRDNGDCKLFILGWAERLGWRSRWPWRGEYDDEAGARALIEQRGGHEAIVREVLGAPREGTPAVRFDIGLIPYDDGFVGAICTGVMWALRHQGKGVVMIRRKVDLVWQVGAR